MFDQAKLSDLELTLLRGREWLEARAREAFTARDGKSVRQANNAIAALDQAFEALDDSAYLSEALSAQHPNLL